MRRAFNLGVGLILAVERGRESDVQSALRSIGEAPFVLGEVIAAPDAADEERVRYA
jgi:phosphoribosylaminoimidazole (AIR) synthetase